MRVWGGGVQWAQSQSHAAFIPHVVKLVEDVTSHNMPLWREDVQDIFADLFLKGSWDSEAPNMNRYTTLESLGVYLTKESYWRKYNTLTVGLSNQGQFQPWE